MKRVGGADGAVWPSMKVLQEILWHETKRERSMLRAINRLERRQADAPRPSRSAARVGEALNQKGHFCKTKPFSTPSRDGAFWMEVIANKALAQREA